MNTWRLGKGIYRHITDDTSHDIFPKTTNRRSLEELHKNCITCFHFSFTCDNSEKKITY
jgi:hypothetical protein